MAKASLKNKKEKGSFFVGDERARALGATAYEFYEEFQRVLHRTLGRVMFQTPSETDLCLLLRLRMWSEKYKISLDFIVTELVGYWASKHDHKRRGALGTKIPTLVGATSERILQDRIAKAYPSGENVTEWFYEKRQRVLDRFIQNTAAKAPFCGDDEPISDFVKAYRDYVSQTRRAADRVLTDFDTLTRRRYRGNPFLGETNG